MKTRSRSLIIDSKHTSYKTLNDLIHDIRQNRSLQWSEEVAITTTKSAFVENAQCLGSLAFRHPKGPHYDSPELFLQSQSSKAVAEALQTLLELPDAQFEAITIQAFPFLDTHVPLPSMLLECLMDSAAHRQVTWKGFVWSAEQSRVLATRTKRLGLEQCHFVDGGDAFVAAMAETNLEALACDGRGFSRDAWSRILQQLYRINEIEFRMCWFQAQDSFAYISHVEQLTFASCQFESLRLLTRECARKGGPRRLSIVGTDFPGSALLFRALGESRGLESLEIDIMDCIPSDGLLETVSNNDNLRILTLGHLQDFQGSTWTSLMTILAQHSSLEQLRIGRLSACTHSMALALANTLQHNRQLKVDILRPHCLVGREVSQIWKNTIEPLNSFNRFHGGVSQLGSLTDFCYKSALLGKALLSCRGPRRTGVLLDSHVDTMVCFFKSVESPLSAENFRQGAVAQGP